MNIYVFGLGHVGLPLACWIAQGGKHVFGIDTDPQVIHDINNGEIAMEEYYHDIPIKTLAKTLIEEGKLSISNQIKRCAAEKATFLISVGLADRPDGSKDLSPILSVIDDIGHVLVPGDLIILRSTVPPGTCAGIIEPKLCEFNVPFHLAYCPETIAETQAFEELENNPLILGAISEESYKAAEVFLNSLSENKIYKAPDTSTAEMAKVVQNLYRDVNIAFANEVCDVAEHLQIDRNELRKLVNVNSRVNMHSCGPGVGGYCLPNALSYLKSALEKPDPFLELSQLAREFNANRPKKIARQVAESLEALEKKVSDSTVAVLGLAMKSFCADIRFSPALDMIRELQDFGANVKAYDPMVPPTFPFQAASFEECIRDSDCLVIAVNQKGFEFNPDKISSLMAPTAIMIDTQNILTEEAR